ncbi:MAG: hypothetical protein IJG42_10680 [Muribaculaceae bacterium]|nr:hypothetical protein [Muribaculaceae bacterium]
MDWNDVLNMALSGGLVGLLTFLLTWRSQARKARAEADTVNITNTEQATRILVENIVEPLKQELNATRRDLSATKREMARLRKAIDDANSCKYSADCPVLRRMREQPKDEHRKPDGRGGPGSRYPPGGQRRARDHQAPGAGERPGEPGEADDSC